MPRIALTHLETLAGYPVDLRPERDRPAKIGDLVAFLHASEPGTIKYTPGDWWGTPMITVVVKSNRDRITDPSRHSEILELANGRTSAHTGIELVMDPDTRIWVANANHYGRITVPRLSDLVPHLMANPQVRNQVISYVGRGFDQIYFDLPD